MQVNRQGIEGVPAHLKVADFRKAQKSDFYISYVILAPDNVYNVYDLAEVKVPAGYTTGDVIEFREPQLNEDYISPKGGHYKCWTNTFVTEDTRRIIIKPIKKTKRVLVVEDEDLLAEDFIESVSARTNENLEIYLRFEVIEREVD